MPRKMSPAERDAHRLRNREWMRKSRQRQRQEILEMENTVQQLEKQYAELCQRSLNETKQTEETVHIDNGTQMQRYVEAFALVKRLGAENLLLQTVLKQNVAWECKLQCILDFEAGDLLCKPQFQIPITDVELDVLDESQAEKELGFYRLSEWDLTRIILDNKREIHHVETRLLRSPVLHGVSDTRTHRMQAFGWDIVQRIEGGVMEFVFTKKFSGLNILEVLRTTWLNDMHLERFRKVKAETRRLQVAQQMNPNAFVFVRDVASPSDISLFRSVFARFLVEATREFPLHISESVTGTGYILGTHSVTTDQTRRLSDGELSGKLAWADLALTIGAFNVVDPISGETCQYVRWVGRTDYCSEEHAQRNASDTLQGMLRWEMLVIAPALNLISLSFDWKLQ